ncbi:hypothetical protein KBI23_09280 [bacterium]|nr:hypothetical protein [bacterium]MBP9810557.1 hypothetical protein [bacterium]
MCNTCVMCQKDIRAFIEFGGPVGFQSTSPDSGRFVCSTKCSDAYFNRRQSEMTAMADSSSPVLLFLPSV